MSSSSPTHPQNHRPRGGHQGGDRSGSQGGGGGGSSNNQNYRTQGGGRGRGRFDYHRDSRDSSDWRFVTLSIQLGPMKTAPLLDKYY